MKRVFIFLLILIIFVSLSVTNAATLRLVNSTQLVGVNIGFDGLLNSGDETFVADFPEFAGLGFNSIGGAGSTRITQVINTDTGFVVGGTAYFGVGNITTASTLSFGENIVTSVDFAGEIFGLPDGLSEFITQSDTQSSIITILPDNTWSSMGTRTSAVSGEYEFASIGYYLKKDQNPSEVFLDVFLVKQFNELISILNADGIEYEAIYQEFSSTNVIVGENAGLQSFSSLTYIGVAPVPLPAGIWLLVSGLIGFIVVKKNF